MLKTCSFIYETGFENILAPALIKLTISIRFNMKKITMRQLADKLNLSIATVSKSFNDSYEISERTKQRVLEGARLFNYTLNPYASSLRRKRSKTIAVIVPEVADSFFSLAIKGIQSIIEVKGYHTLIYLSHESFMQEKAIIEEIEDAPQTP